jgi:hypothetical protein
VTIWKKYTDLEPIKRLREDERAGLKSQNTIYLFEKRDGENVSIWLDEENVPHISSHNNVNADEDIQRRMKLTPEYERIVDLLKYQKHFLERNLIAYGELEKPISPTRLEPRRKHCHWIMFDLYDCATEKYLHNLELQPLAYSYRIPMPKIILAFSTAKLEDAETYVQDALKWCVRHHREGIVGKCFETQVYFKEKRVVPHRPKLRVPQERIDYPAMPEETIQRAFEHAVDEVEKVGGSWSNVKIAMPILAKHMQLEGAEHSYAVPKNIYQMYLKRQEIK